MNVEVFLTRKVHRIVIGIHSLHEVVHFFFKQDVIQALVVDTAREFCLLVRGRHAFSSRVASNLRALYVPTSLCMLQTCFRK